MSPFGDMNKNAQKLDHDAVWRALADPVRRAILDALVTGPETTGDLVSRFKALSRTAVMKHLDVLVAADLVMIRRVGRVRWNSLNPVPVERVCQRWVNAHVRPLASSMNRLKRLVEADVDD
jgi:DNA-binding transcriptional ArsR family regulator